jgi:short-subunit dehydrogenase
MKLTRIAVRALLGKNKPGVVLLVSSLAGLYANYTAALYFASKSALVNFAHSMAQADEDEDVKVVAICPR